MTPLDKDFYEGILSMKRENKKNKKNIERELKSHDQPGKLLTTYQELMDTVLSSYTLPAEAKTLTFSAYKGDVGEGKSKTSLDDVSDAAMYANMVYGNFKKSQEPVLQDKFIENIVDCFKKAFETIYSNECPLELVNLCKEYVGNFVKSLDGSTKM